MANYESNRIVQLFIWDCPSAILFVGGGVVNMCVSMWQPKVKFSISSIILHIYITFYFVCVCACYVCMDACVCSVDTCVIAVSMYFRG